MKYLIHEDEQSALCLMFISAAMLSILVSREHCRGSAAAPKMNARELIDTSRTLVAGKRSK